MNTQKTVKIPENGKETIIMYSAKRTLTVDNLSSFLQHLLWETCFTQLFSDLKLIKYSFLSVVVKSVGT